MFHPSLVVLLACAVVVGTTGCRAGRQKGGLDAGPQASERLRATCSTLESGPCPVEDVDIPVGGSRVVPSGSVYAHCVLSAEGRIEACRGLDSSAPVARAIQEALEGRRYQPVTFRGRAVPVPYLFLVTAKPAAASEKATSTASQRTLTPVCRDLEHDRCTAERLVVDEAALREVDAPHEFWTNEELDVSCILRETGAVESCSSSDIPEAIARLVTSYLHRRRYSPARYQGTPVPVAYEFKVALSLVPSEGRSAFRRAAFEFLVDEAIRYEGDGGVRRLCLALGKEEEPAEAAQIHRSGWEILPAAECAVRFPYAYAHLVRFDLLNGHGTARAMVGLSEQGGESLKLEIERADAGWQLRIHGRSEYVH